MYIVCPCTQSHKPLQIKQAELTISASYYSRELEFWVVSLHTSPWRAGWNCGHHLPMMSRNCWPALGRIVVQGLPYIKVRPLHAWWNAVRVFITLTNPPSPRPSPPTHTDRENTMWFPNDRQTAMNLSCWHLQEFYVSTLINRINPFQVWRLCSLQYNPVSWYELCLPWHHVALVWQLSLAPTEFGVTSLCEKGNSVCDFMARNTGTWYAYNFRWTLIFAKPPGEGFCHLQLALHTVSCHLEDPGVSLLAFAGGGVLLVAK